MTRSRPKPTTRRNRVNLTRRLVVTAEFGVNLEGVTLDEVRALIRNNAKIRTAAGPMKWSKRADGPRDLFANPSDPKLSKCCARPLDMLFRCETCGAVVCFCYGAADDMPGSCDTCWAKEERKRTREAS